MLLNSQSISQLIQIAGISTIITVVSVYTVSLSALYLYYYWRSFKLNVFEYLSLGDLVTHAMPFFIPLILMFTVLPDLEFILPKLQPQLLHLNPFLGRFQSYIPHGTLVGLSILMLSSLLFRFHARIYIAIIIFLLLLITIRTGYNPELAALLILYLPLFATFSGTDKASEAKQGKKVLLVDLSKSALPLSVDQHQQVGYLGRLGDVFVLYDIVSERLIIVRHDKFESLVLVPANSAETIHIPVSAGASPKG